MISPHVMKKGTVVEITKDIIDNFNPQDSLFKGEQFVVVNKMSKQGGSALIANIKNIKTDAEHEIFWVFIKHNMKVISIPEEGLTTHFSPSDISLNENEEYVIVHKDKPNLFYRTFFYPSYHALAKDDFIEGSAMFTAKKGYRKKYKNRQSLNAFLSGIGGARDWTITQSTPVENIYHISGFLGSNAQYYHEASYPSDFVAMAKEFFVVKKYNKDTKTMYDEPVNFSIRDYIENIERKVKDTFNYGEAISQVLGMLRENNKMDEYPFIFSTKYNAEDYEKELTIYNVSCDNIPRDKDVFFELLVKESKKKKKDLFLYNKNGFAAIACKDKEMLDYFKNGYINPMKVINVIETKDHL